MTRRNILGSVLIGAFLVSGMTFGDDWPQWRGPKRDDVSAEKGLLSNWPEGGPPQIWKNEKCGLGYSGFSVVGDRLFTMGEEGDQQFILCLNAADGSEIWRTSFSENYNNGWGDGPRGTPTVDGNQVFTLSASGTVACFSIGDGSQVWAAKMADFGGDVPDWGYCESVLVDGDQVVCTPGGRQGAILALDRNTGEKIWQSSDFTDGAQYASIVSATINGKKQYVQLTMQSVVGIDSENGKVIWRADWPGQTAVIPTPIVRGDSVYVASGYGVGSQRFDIDGGTAKSVWSNKVMKNHHGGVILVGDHLYGYSDGPGWTCQDWNTGEAVWTEGSKLGKGAIGYADGCLYCVSEKGGDVALVEANPMSWEERGRFKLSPQTKRRSNRGAIWTHPVIANGRLYLRDQDIIVCYDISQK